MYVVSVQIPERVSMRFADLLVFVLRNSIADMVQRTNMVETITLASRANPTWAAVKRANTPDANTVASQIKVALFAPQVLL